jgi:hypothetical protein
MLYILTGYRATATDVVSMVSSVVSTLQVEDPTRSGIFNKGPVTRSQDYTRMDDQYTYVVHRPA